MPPSASDILSFGNFCMIGDHSRSAAKIAVWNGIACGITENGVRGMKLGKPPKWKTATLPRSLHACHAASHSGPWRSAVPKRCGSEWNEIAWQPFSATRAISLAIQSAPSTKPLSASGMKRPGYAPHHAWMCQSL